MCLEAVLMRFWISADISYNAGITLGCSVR
jgi:hypothetical protein